MTGPPTSRCRSRLARTLLALGVVWAVLGAAPPVSADHTGPRCEVPTLTHSTDDGAHVMLCYPDGRVGAGTFDNGPTYVLWDPAAHLVTLRNNYLLVYVDGTEIAVCNSSGTWYPGDPKPDPAPGNGSCHP